jgi:DNA repair ATPase RecN
LPLSFFELLQISISSSSSSSSSSNTAGASITRSRVVINGVPSSLRVLRALSGLLMDINGQHAALALRDGQQQLQLLDKIAGRCVCVGGLSGGHSSR